VRCSAFKWFLGFHKNYYTEVVGPCGWYGEGQLITNNRTGAQ
jgi:hypothetical protein